MKHSKILLVALAAGGIMTSCADQEVDNFYVEMPESLTTYEYLNEYGAIKDQLDRAAYPNFKIACALSAEDYSKRGVWYRVANNNFDEITLGNDMKYASIVADDGSMDFGTVQQLLADADQAGMSVYGHTLAWHAQQNTNYLNAIQGDIEIPSYTIQDYAIDFSEYDEYPFTVVGGYKPEIVDGLLVADKKQSKFYIAEGLTTVPGQKYDVNIGVRASGEAAINIIYGDGKDDKVSVSVSPEMADKRFSFVANKDNTFFRIELGRQALKLEFAYVEVAHNTPSSRPQTAEEKTDTIKRAMEKWIDGMMEACNGQVKAWDLINEAVGGADNDGDGWYDLQTAATGGASDFFWQDWIGHDQYGAFVAKAARESFAKYGGNPNDLKLFVNDYNLESDWDATLTALGDNPKLKSMIHWIEVWEKNGAKIDGVSSQMHISYYENKQTMASKAKHIVNMLHLMANTGKLVRISELDMGYVDKNGNDVKPANMTKQQRQNQANLYRFIIQMYLKIVPAAQQYSICQWCLTDAPANSGWRADSPVGLWDLNWNRVPAYAGYCEAFSTALPSTEDFFEFLQANGLEHFIAPDPVEE